MEKSHFQLKKGIIRLADGHMVIEDDAAKERFSLIAIYLFGFLYAIFLFARAYNEGDKFFLFLGVMLAAVYIIIIIARLDRLKKVVNEIEPVKIERLRFSKFFFKSEVLVEIKLKDTYSRYVKLDKIPGIEEDFANWLRVKGASLL